MKKAVWCKRLLVPEKKLREALELYPGKTKEEVSDRLYGELRKRLTVSIPVVAGCLLLAWYSGKTVTEEAGIVRPAPGNTGNPLQIQVELDEGWKEINLEVGSLEYEESRIEELHTEAVNYLSTAILGQNENRNHITGAMVFPETLSATGGKIIWSTDAPWVITSAGEVINKNLKEPVTVQIKAEISYGSESRFFLETVTVYPAVLSEEEALLEEIQETLQEQEQRTRKEKRFALPETVMGYRIELMQSSGVGGSGFFVLLAMVVPVFLYSNYFGNLETKRKERKEQAERSYTEFITKVSLMLAAGISVRQTFVRLSSEYEKHYGSQHVLAEELRVTTQELDNGRSEMVVYEEFGRRIGVLAYRRMASLLTRNVSKGVQDLRNLLLQEAKEVMAQERANIRQKGEQAGTKLLLPMTGLLVLVFAILLVPAFQSF